MPIIASLSGVRGIYDDGLDERVAFRYAFAYFLFIKNNSKGKTKKIGENKSLTLVIGSDTRPSREILKNAAIEALNCTIIDLGIASTPMVEFCVRFYKADGGIIVTASHNEPEWNGFKFLDNTGSVLPEKDMDKVIANYKKIQGLSDEQLLKQILPAKNSPTKKITLSKKIIKKYEESDREYEKYALSFLSSSDIARIKKAKFKLLIDPNGGSGTIAKPVLEKLGINARYMNMEHGFFARKIEPNYDSLFYLSNIVREEKYHFAAGFDCDADRVEIMTDTGLVSGNHLLALCAEWVLKDSKRKTIVVNNATSLMVRDIAKRHKAKYVEVEVGESNVVSKMYSLNAPIAGEGSSGGVIIPPNRCRDGLVTLLFLLKILSQGISIHSALDSLPKYYNIKNKIELKGKTMDAMTNTLVKYYKNKKYKVVNPKNGAIKIYPDKNSFIWIRDSKTEVGVLRIITDAQTEDKAQSLMNEALQLLR